MISTNAAIAYVRDKAWDAMDNPDGLGDERLVHAARILADQVEYLRDELKALERDARAECRDSFFEGQRQERYG